MELAKGEVRVEGREISLPILVAFEDIEINVGDEVLRRDG